MKIITRTIWILSLVSMFTDIASEMLYPVMPIYLKKIGFSVMIIGLLEGFAEATAGLSKGYFGKMSDNTGKRLPFVRWGYFLSAVSKPMMAAFIYPLWVFLARTTDRLGKGVRTAARDAMLSDEATAKTKGTVFGFHRSMDTLGAFIGPIVALLLLYFFPGQYRMIFLLAFIPGLAAIGFTWILKDKKASPKESGLKTNFFDFFSYWRDANSDYRRLVTGLLIFALFNSSDVFLLLKISEAGYSDTITVGSYIFYNLIFALLAYPFGILADKLGLKKIFVSGLVLFAIVYAGISVNDNFYVFLALFFLYGAYAAATEGVAKAWITNITQKENTATAIGTYTAFQSICTLLASSITGFLWYQFNAKIAFLTIAIVSFVLIFYFLSLNKATVNKQEE